MLYIVGTPIGNVQDISYRAVATLFSSDIILAEDTRSAKTLLEKSKLLFDVPKHLTPKLESFHKDNEFEKLPAVLERLEEDKTISLISEAGMPTISDPGITLIQSAIRKGFPFTVVPGPTAVTTALVHSGFKAKKWMFVGYFPKKISERKKILKNISKISEIEPETVFVAFESPHRFVDTLALLESSFEFIVGRELTKLYEEVIRSDYKEIKNKGEMTIVFRKKS